MGSGNSYDVVIVDGGCAGITVAAQLRKHSPKLRLAIVEPSDKHWYQPGFTLVGAGVFSRQQMEREERGLIPAGADWLRTAVTSFNPEASTAALADGKVIG